jgi:hypothetical protein
MKMDNPAAIARAARVMKIGFIAFAVLLMFLVMKMPAQPRQPSDPLVANAITVLALLDGALGLVMPRFLVRSARRRPGSARPVTPVQQWFTGVVVSYAFFTSICLFGFALHFLGADLRRSELLIGVGIVSMVAVFPKAPPEDDERQIPPKWGE